MRHRHHHAALYALAAVATLTGCGDKKAPDTVASGAVAPEVVVADPGAKPRAGHWQVKLQIDEFNIPGLPDNLKQNFSRQMAQAGDIGSCLTPEEAARNDGKFFGPRDADCTYQNFAMAKGQVSADMTCDKRGTKQTVQLRGSYGAEAYDLTLHSKSDINGQPMTMSMHVTGKRTGECTGREKS